MLSQLKHTKNLTMMLSRIWILPTLKPLLPGSPSLPESPCDTKWRWPLDIIKGKTFHGPLTRHQLSIKLSITHNPNSAEMEGHSPLAQENLECPSLLWHLVKSPNPEITTRILVSLSVIGPHIKSVKTECWFHRSFCCLSLPADPVVHKDL